MVRSQGRAVICCLHASAQGVWATDHSSFLAPDHAVITARSQAWSSSSPSCASCQYKQYISAPLKVTCLLSGSFIHFGRKSCFPETEEKVKHLKRKNAELAVIAKRLEERARKLQEANLKVEGHHCLNLIDFDHLLRESQKEVLRLQRQIALKNFKESLHSSKSSSEGSFSTAAMRLGPSVPMPNACIKDSSKGVQLGKLTLEFELRKKRKKCENLEHEVRKKHKRCKELVSVFAACRTGATNRGVLAFPLQVESENADLKLRVVLVTKERDSAIQTSQGLQTKLENLEQVLKHMRDVAERRQKLEVEHEEALLVLREKQEEVRRLQQAQAEAKREHEGAVQLLEVRQKDRARVRDLEDQCRSQTEQFSLLSQELKHFRLQTGKIDLLTSTLVTCDLPLAPCSSTPQPQGGTVELEPLPQISDPAPGVTKIPLPSAAASQKPAKKTESQSSSSKSESMQNSPKSCPTPEVDTASEMEELDVDSVSLIPEPGNQGPAKLQVFLARYSYNPFDGPNENPEAELPLTAGEYIYIYGDMDEDGFFEGELMDGRRGLVPSNFVERVSDDDLVTFLPPELNDLTHSSYHEKSFVSTSTSNGDKSDYSAEETSVSPLLSRLEGDQDEPVSHTAVPYPRKLVLIKQLARSIVVGWEPPLLPAGYPEIQSYNIYVDAELWQNVKSGPQTKAIVEKLDLKTKAYRISVQSVTEQGSSDRLRCTFFVGQDFCIAPTLLKVRNITATSAEVTWLPCNSNYNHAVYLNEEECDTIKPGVYWYTFHNLHPNTQYVAKVETRPPKMLWELPLEKHEQKSAVVHFTTPLAGIPDAPLDVQVELGPSPGILVISWLPVTIDAEGSSNGVRVTGYAVYADGRKVMEVTSPTAGSILVDLSQLQMFQVCQEVSVRTMSVYGESVDSVPAQISSTLLKASSHCSPPQSAVSTTSTSKLLCGEPRYSLPVQTPLEGPFVQFWGEAFPSIGHSCFLIALQAHLIDLFLARRAISASASYPASLLSAVPATLCCAVLVLLADGSILDTGGGGAPVALWPLLIFISSLSLFACPPCGLSRGLGTQQEPCDTDSDEEILERILELPLQKNCSKKLFSIPEVTEEEDEGEEEEEEKQAQNPGSPEPSWGQKRESCNWSYQESSMRPTTGASPLWGKRKGSYQERAHDRPEATRKRQSDAREHCSRLLGNCSQTGGSLYRVQSLREKLNVISAGGKDGLDIGSHMRQGSFRKSHRKLASSHLAESASMASHCISSRSLEIDIEYDSEEEQDLTFSPMHASQLWPNCKVEEAQAHRKERSASGNGEPRSQELPGLPSWQSSTRKGSKNLRRSQVSKPPISTSEATVKEDSVRIFVALFDYDPVSMSPNPDAAEEELPFKEGQILKVCGDKDADGFYRGECAGKAGYIPCNMVSEVQVENNDMKKQLLKQGYIPPGTSVESVGNGTFSPPPRRLTVPPPKPRRSKKGLSHLLHKCQDLEAELLVPRSMVAVFDYNPKESSPNVDVEEYTGQDIRITQGMQELSVRLVFVCFSRQVSQLLLHL
uniref:TSPO associated protein 1 n=1 Tax=Crocodylus porosus TaxID=8502 RepID=A0A7M4EKN6_CROPO